ncbi:alpha/beta fold hydrolase [Roseivirga thermotolerans]|uniref:alpha/beta fold hydrolase n=2 Tax=Roseivirga thermotolerans TaxID=1758176 RepID=UPI00273D6590|nr:alpha/beta fold hydrolase [Roseivirga thermotolerans]MEC7752468.1 alpha/beta fold hydrolase [Bacteroidota bacterium]
MKHILLTLALIVMYKSSNAQNWLNTTEYPFHSNYLTTEHGKLHFIDEGKGEVILFVHGTPTWSFLYRNYIKALSGTYRCIALDHIGFGLSDKPKNFAGTPQEHAKNLNLLIEHLNLKNITLVVHDFGGPIGLAYAIANPENVKRIVMFNTWLWETENDKDAQKINKILHSWLGNYLYLNTNFSPSVLLKKAFYNKKHLSKNIHKQYKKPFPNKGSRYGLLNIGKSLIGSSDWYGQLWKQADAIKDKPVLILWGEKDDFIKKDNLEKWKSFFSKDSTYAFEAGHFVQEEKTEETIEIINNWLKNSSIR